ncbi:MAG: hypothetical protein WCO63_04675 [Bacteroidota bacterium]
MPTDHYSGINLKQLHLPSGILQNGNTYYWRLRYCDHNIRWSERSAPKQLIITPNIPDTNLAGITGIIRNNNLAFTPLQGVSVILKNAFDKNLN